MPNPILTAAALAVGGVLLSKQLKKNRASGMSSSLQEAIEVNVPVRTAYNQFTQFEDFPKFMESVHEIRQLDDRHLRWRADVGGKPEEWDSEITEQIPDKRIAWRSITGVPNAGVVTFHKISDDTTRVMMQMDYTPQSIDEKIGDALGLVRMEMRKNLQRYKELVEGRGVETGAWRGTITQH